jgi:hypothetical protein
MGLLEGLKLASHDLSIEDEVERCPNDEHGQRCEQQATNDHRLYPPVDVAAARNRRVSLQEIVLLRRVVSQELYGTILAAGFNWQATAGSDGSREAACESW